jgi:hypothetical protein
MASDALSPMFRYRLVDRSGQDLGPFASRLEDWPAGARIALADGADYGVVAVEPAPAEATFRAYIVVERV